MITRTIAALSIVTMLAALTACGTPAPSPFPAQSSGGVTPSPGSAYNPVSGASAQD